MAKIGDRQVVRELWPVNTFFSQAGASAHLGLGVGETVDELSIRWPSGKEQLLKAIGVNRHILIQEGNAKVNVVEPGEPMPF